MWNGKLYIYSKFFSSWAGVLYYGYTWTSHTIYSYSWPGPVFKGDNKILKIWRCLCKIFKILRDNNLYWTYPFILLLLTSTICQTSRPRWCRKDFNFFIYKIWCFFKQAQSNFVWLWLLHSDPKQNYWTRYYTFSECLLYSRGIIDASLDSARN